MKKFLGLTLLIAVCGCTANPTVSNPTVTQTLVISSSTNPQVYLVGNGTFYDITTNTTSSFTLGNTTGTWTFQTGKHDTVEFTLTLTAQESFNYSLGTTLSSATTSSSGTYTSPEITF